MVDNQPTKKRMHNEIKQIKSVTWQDSKTEGVMKNDGACQWWIIVHAEEWGQPRQNELQSGLGKC
jgi:hypothetical protein